MDSFPVEVVDNIVKYVDPQDRTALLTVSRNFQFATEKYSEGLKRAVIANADDLLSVYKDVRRWRVLRKITFAPSLPRHKFTEECSSPSPSPRADHNGQGLDASENTNPQKDSNDHDGGNGHSGFWTGPYCSGYSLHTCRESKQAIEERDIAFTEQIAYLFNTIHELELQHGPGNIHLTINSPTVVANEKAIDMCAHRWYIAYHLRLLNPHTLPELKSIRALEHRHSEKELTYMVHESLTLMAGNVFLDIASRLPSLEHLNAPLDYTYQPVGSGEGSRACTRPYPGPRRDSRHSIINSISKLPPTLTSVCFRGFIPDQLQNQDHTLPLPNLVSPSLNDPFSTALRILSYNLRDLQIRGVLDSNLFWPSSPSESEPAWPHLETMEILFHPSTPSGGWYFDSPPWISIPASSVTDGFAIPPSSTPSPHYPPYTTTTADRNDDKDWENGGLYGKYYDTFRVEPSLPTIVPFLQSVAKAAQRMERLTDMAVWTYLLMQPQGLLPPHGERGLGTERVVRTVDWNHPERWRWPLREGNYWGIFYSAPTPTTTSKTTAERTTSRSLLFNTLTRTLDVELKKEFRKIGLAQHGEKLVEKLNGDPLGLLPDKEERSKKIGDIYDGELHPQYDWAIFNN